MKARAATVGRRLAVGTWRQLETWPRWQFAVDYQPDETGVRAVAQHLGVVLRRVAGTAGAVTFYVLLLERAPGGIYLMPAVWAIGAWQMSDTSATPPPRVARPSCRECAGHELVGVTPLAGRKGMLIYKTSPPGEPHRTHLHVAAGEVNSE
ncbi:MULTISPECIES: hypothetical protein [unclassified Streptomyces]|uniref:hypothetical protein n=1 Tax=unclassified Streptomyces TaxID=2593676 RepID=UPI002E2CD6E0|nr:hypothetical protein [Streptomyces sp. NBC_00228]